jgi:putative hydrolase of the HAD superfamily
MERDSYRIFDPVVLSWQVGSAKPQGRIFEVLIETLHLNPHEVLLIDDVAANITAAKDLGLRGLLFTDAETLKSNLASLL